MGISGILSAESVVGTVDTEKDPLLLRFGPGQNSPVVGRAAKGSKLTVTGKKGNWLEVVAPEYVKVYVARHHISKNQTTADLMMRSRMDGKSLTYGKLPKGTAVKIISEHAHGWARIAPPASLRVYALSFYVQYDAGAVKNIAVEKAENVPEKPAATEKSVVSAQKIKSEKTAVEKPAVKAEEKKPAVPAVKAEEKKPAVPAVKAEEKKTAVKAENAAPAFSESDPRVAELKKLEVDVFKAPCKQVTVRGTLVAIHASPNLATNYAIGTTSSAIIGFVCAAEDGMVNPFVNKEVVLTGRQFKVKGWKSPIIWLDEIDLAK